MALKSEVLEDKAVEKFLAVTLEDGEDIMGSMKKAASEHGLDEFRVVEVRGLWKDGFMNYFLRDKFKSRHTFDIEKIKAGSGKFVRKGAGYEGDLHIAVAVGNNTVNGTLLEGKAAKELTIRLKFLQFL